MLRNTLATVHAAVVRSSLPQQIAVDKIREWQQRPSHELIFDSGRREISQYMQAVDLLCQSSHARGFGELISIARARLRGEFTAILGRQAEYQAGPISTTEWSSDTDGTDYDSESDTDSIDYAFMYEDFVVSDPPSDYAITYLRNIAERMNSIGKIGECIEMYKTVRRNFLNSQLKRLRFEGLSMGCNTRRYVWDEKKLKMELWIQVSKICVNILFEREKKLCEQIFDNVAKDECFMETIQDFAVSLFSFVEVVSLSNQSCDRMEAVLGLYGAFVWVLPYANALFDCELGKGIRSTLAQILSRMENDVGRMLYGFENSILNEASHVYDDDREVVHICTCYVMEQVEMIVRNKNLLTTLIKSTPLLRFGNLNIPQEALGDWDNRSFLELHLILILVVLQRNLGTKSRSYKNPSLGHLSVMNNVRYILQKIEESSGVQEMIGYSYMRKLNENFKAARGGFETSTCNELLSCFKDEGLYSTGCFRSRPSRTAIRKRIKYFNAAFEEIRCHHSSWTIPDSKLREDVKVSMSKKVVPAYENFLEKFASNPEIKRIMDKNVKYSAEDLVALLYLIMDGDVKYSAENFEAFSNLIREKNVKYSAEYVEALLKMLAHP